MHTLIIKQRPIADMHLTALNDHQIESMHWIIQCSYCYFGVYCSKLANRVLAFAEFSFYKVDSLHTTPYLESDVL